MLLEIILFLFLGIFFGIFTGLAPGIHINLVSVILVSLSASFLFLNPIFLVVFIVAMAITHTFVDFIPSIFLGAPDEGVELSVLPGHEMLKQGKGYEAIMLTNHGSLAAIFILILVSVPLVFLVPKIYNFISSAIPFILILVSLFMIFSEKEKFSSLLVFVLSGILGLIVLNLETLNQPLLPLLSGLFGASSLLISIKTKTKIPNQKKTKSKVNLFKPLTGSLFSSLICGFLPGLGSGQAAIIGNLISKSDRKGFLVLLGATNTLVMGLSFVALYTIQKTRTGAAASIQELIGEMPKEMIVLIFAIVLISGILSFFVTKILAEFFSNKIEKINYTKLSLVTLIFLSIIVFLVSGFLGFFVFLVSAMTGVYCISLKVKRTLMMACLLLPTILLYLLN
ncbi:tripartite tricarboxylate transporter permease [Candidatus Pacearchaeota archaeon]|nr:tripartite tricarboxylate transporter permease [Candidatus Pacearchaeota archaeon]